MESGAWVAPHPGLRFARPTLPTTKTRGEGASAVALYFVALPAIRHLLLRLAGILDVLEGRELDVVQFAVDLLDLADIDVLHDVAGFRVDGDRTARALPGHTLHRRDQRNAVGLAAGLLQRLVDQVDAA